MRCIKFNIFFLFCFLNSLKKEWNEKWEKSATERKLRNSPPCHHLQIVPKSKGKYGNKKIFGILLRRSRSCGKNNKRRGKEKERKKQREKVKEREKKNHGKVVAEGREYCWFDSFIFSVQSFAGTSYIISPSCPKRNDKSLNR